MKDSLKEFCRTINIEYAGIAPPGPYVELEHRLRKREALGQLTGFEERELARRLDSRLTLPDARSVIVCLFPYFSGHKPEANIAKSAYSLDYHSIVSKKLGQICDFLKSRIPDFNYKAFVDNGPLADRYLAYLAGLGFFGINSHIITDRYGSYVFIGYIINNYPFALDKPLDRTCIQCGSCIKSCPGFAIPGNFDINPLRCRSFITQKKEELSRQDTDILKNHSLIFGCDICQDVCPHNKDVELTNMEEFRSDVKYILDFQELSAISNKEFLRRYKDRAFGWRGKKILFRNSILIREE